MVNKILRINLSEKNFKYEKVPVDYERMGGRGLISKIICHEIKPYVHPLSKENKLVLAPGLLAGTRISMSSRLSIGAKSPLTGGIKESNVGSDLAAKLGFMGLKALIIEGKAEKPCTVVKIDDEGCAFYQYGYLKNKGNYETARFLREVFGDKVEIVSIGQGGENCQSLLMPELSVSNTWYFDQIICR